MKIIFAILRHLWRYGLGYAGLFLVAGLMSRAIEPGPDQVTFAAMAVIVAALWAVNYLIDAKHAEREVADLEARLAVADALLRLAQVPHWQRTGNAAGWTNLLVDGDPEAIHYGEASESPGIAQGESGELDGVESWPAR